MASFETRDVVKQYELHHNPMLLGILPGGVMESLEIKQPCEALLVPRHVSLEVTHMAPYLLATVRKPVAAPPISALFDEPQETPERNASEASGSAARGRGGAAAASSGVTFPPENAVAFKAALQRFFEHHLLHFDGFGNSEFTNLRGQRGAFAEDLDHVKRFGFVGQVAVLADADPLRPRATRTPSGSPGAPGTRAFACHPTSLQIFVIDEPLMDAAELRYVTDALHKLSLSTPAPSSPAAAPVKVDGAIHVAPRAKASLADIPFLMGDRDASHVGARGRALAEPVPMGSPQLSRLTAARDSHRGDRFSGEESIAETVVIDDFEEDPTDEPDLDAYVAKYTRISERQRQRSSAAAIPVESPAGGRTSTGSYGSGQGQAVGAGSGGGRTPPLPGTLAVGHIVAQVSAAQPVATFNVLGAPSPSLASIGTRGAAADGAMAAVARRAQDGGARAGGAAAAAATTGATTPAQATVVHANVLRHEYSRECIKDYRRVVAADNEIFYSEFERLMSLKCSGALAKLMSEYVSKNQQLQQPILNNMKYNKFIERCHALVRQTPRLSADPEVATIMLEGIERYTTARLYRQIYNVSEDEKRKNALLQSKLLRLENMPPSRLEALPEVERHHVWGQAMFELDGMDFFRSPREKLRCGMRACELLSLAVGDILRQRRNASGRGGGKTSPSAAGGAVPLAFGADEFLPCFLLLVLRALPLSFVQNVCYIERFRYPTLMSPEESYCFATLQSALLFWQNCNDDAQMTAPANERAATTAEAPLRSGGSASIGALTTAATATAPAAATSLSLTRALAPPQQQPPRMTERDLLPSVRQASLSGRQHPGAGDHSTAVPADGVVHAEEEAPTVLDVLFGWANRNLGPIANEIGFGNTASASGLGGAPSAARRGSSSGNGEAPTSPAPSGAKQPSPPRGTVVDLDAPVPQAEVVTREVHFGDALMHASSAPSFTPPRTEPNLNTRARARELLVTQHKTFEQLTLTELQMIVEEARQLLTEAKP